MSGGYPSCFVPSMTGCTSSSLPTLSKMRKATASPLMTLPVHTARLGPA